MSMSFNCSACGRGIAAEVGPGAQVQCPFCNQIITVPAPTAAPAAAVYPHTVSYRPQPYVTPQSQGLAVAALVCGILGIFGCPLVGIVGLVMGIVALTRAN